MTTAHPSAPDALGPRASDEALVPAPTGQQTSAPRTWARPRPDRRSLRIDAALAGLACLGSVVYGLLYARVGMFDRVAEPWVWAIGIALATLPLALRRRYPVPVALAVAAGFFVCNQFGVPDLLVVQITMFCALYTVGAWEQNRRLAFWSRFGITVAMLAWVGIDLLIASSDSDALAFLSRSTVFSAFAAYAVINISMNLFYFGGAFLFGERAWRTARLQARLSAQGHELELERETSAAQAVALDRIAIARELHDVVAHHVSVMGIQAAAARRSIASSPERAAASLEIVENSAHEAVAELRSLVHTLRAPTAEDPSSTLGVAQLGSLVSHAQQAGTPTTLIVAGEPRPLPLLVDTALYRVAQEALTNVRKHAGRGATAEVRLRFTANAVELEVADDGVRQALAGSATASRSARSSQPGGLPGLGLRGMRERIGAVGGTLVTERRERGGFLVRASAPLSATRLPEAAAAEPSEPAHPADQHGDEPATAPNRGGRAETLEEAR